MKTGSETKKQDRSENAMTDSCPECGMEKAEWPHPTGVRQAGEMYCCKGCADGTGCTCGDDDTQ